MRRFGDKCTSVFYFFVIGVNNFFIFDLDIHYLVFGMLGSVFNSSIALYI